MKNTLTKKSLKPHLNIGGKLFFAIAGSSLLIATLAFAFLIPMDIQRIKQMNEDETSAFIKAFNKDFIRVIFLNTTEESVNLTEHLQNFPLVKSVTLVNNDRYQLFSYIQSQDEKISDNSFSKQNIYGSQEINKVINYMGVDYGHINLVISNVRLNNRIEQYFQLVTPLILSLIIVAFVVARLLRNYFAKPIIGLSDAVKEIAEHRDYSKQIHSDSKDEVGLLCRGFNELLNTVEHTRLSLAKEKEQAIFTLNSITDAVIRTDHLGNIEYMNPVAIAMTGYTKKDYSSKSIEELFSVITAHDKKSVLNPIMQCIHENKVIDEKDDHVMIMHNHHGIDVEYSAAPIHDQNKNVIGTVLVFKDVTQERENARRLSYMASHDSLTGMYNRHTFEKHIKRAIDSAHNKNYQHILFFMDLDNFKIINDSLGHLAGDEVLRSIATLLSDSVRDTDILSRLGGDEFGALLTDCDTQKGKIVAENMRVALESYRLNWKGKSYQISVSIGIVNITADSKDITEVLNAADSACYAAKRDGRNCIREYSKENSSTSNIKHFPSLGSQ